MSRSSNLQNLLYLFDRPCLPIFQPKGKNADISFDIPTSYYTDRYRPIKDQIITRSPGTTLISVTEISPPDISLAASLDRRANFSLFNPFHIECAGSLITVFMNARTAEDFKSVCVYAQPRVNPYLFIYALTVAYLHRPDTKNLPLPSHACQFPELYVDGTVLAEARSVGTVLPDGYRDPIEIPRDLTASDLDPEHRLAYFREDIGINLHHWHWHVIYPTSGPRNLVNKDRRGELFYYMHQQIIARYNFERLSNNLSRAAKFVNFEDAIPEAYFPKLDTVLASRVWPSRQENARLSDISRESDNIFVTIDDMKRWRDRIYEAIQRGSVNDGTSTLVPLSEETGIDVVGNLIESSILSVNRTFYGNFHNQGHNMISFIHDPDHRYLETFGVMGENTTAMRDPVFYRWHTSINDIFDAYKQTLTPYTTDQLGFSGIQVTGVEVVVDGVNGSNNLQTFWERDQFDLSRGLDFVPRGGVFAAFSHLQHTPFTYRITVQNTGNQRVGTVRIFLAPKRDERGREFRLRDQRQMFIELDRFTTNLRSGSNTISRKSNDSSLTVPFDQTFRNLDSIDLTSTNAADTFVFCGCGWPQHMLIPKGTPEGLLCDLFVMITDNQQDRVENSSMDSGGNNCDAAFSFCGVRDRRYPDRKAMGFPFDRLPRSGVVTLNQFLTPNMRTQDIRIRFTDRTTQGRTLTEANRNSQTGQLNTTSQNQFQQSQNRNSTSTPRKPSGRRQ